MIHFQCYFRVSRPFFTGNWACDFFGGVKSDFGRVFGKFVFFGRNHLGIIFVAAAAGVRVGVRAGAGAGAVVGVVLVRHYEKTRIS